MGQPIEEQAAKSAGKHTNGDTEASRLQEQAMRDAARLDHGLPQMTEAMEQGVASASFAEQNKTPAVLDPTSSARLLMRAQQIFIAAQTAFIHDKGNLPLMFGAQMDYIVELQHFIGVADMPSILSLQEGFIAALHNVIEQKGLG